MRSARLDRRKFLQRSVALVGAVASGGLLAACGDDESPVTDLSELASTISGRVIAPGDRGYRAARQIWNARYDAARPVAVVEVADAADVRRTVDFARDRELRLIPRSGAHSFAGYSTGGGVVVDLSRLDDVEVARGAERARRGLGVLSPHRLAFTDFHGVEFRPGREVCALRDRPPRPPRAPAARPSSRLTFSSTIDGKVSLDAGARGKARPRLPLPQLPHQVALNTRGDRAG